jgi:uracil-DNA glycosylase
MTPAEFKDVAKSLGNPTNRDARETELRATHIEPLTSFVDRLRGEMGSGYEIPYFDPWDGGINAEVLFLLEAPGPQAKGSGFISRNNPDETAKNFFEFSRLISRHRTIIWNIVPWYIGGPTKIRAANSQDIDEGIKSLDSLLNLLPKLKAIVLLGKKAQRAETRISKLRPNIRIFRSLHPSPLCVNRFDSNRATIQDAFEEVANYLTQTTL